MLNEWWFHGGLVMSGKVVVLADAQFEIVLLSGLSVVMVDDIIFVGHEISHGLRFVGLAILTQGEMSGYCSDLFIPLRFYWFSSDILITSIFCGGWNS